MNSEFGIGDLVVVKLAHVKGMDTMRSTSAAVVEEIYGDLDGTMRVRLTGLTPAPYEPGMVLAIDGDKVTRKGAVWGNEIR
ncbi:MAG: hypothetical protein ACSLE9_07890 [Burkholderiaceae bacterium]